MARKGWKKDAEGGRAPLAGLAAADRAAGRRRRRTADPGSRWPTPRWSTSHSLMPPRMPAVLSTMVTSSARWCRFTRREFPPPM